LEHSLKAQNALPQIEVHIEAGFAERHYWRDLWHYRDLLSLLVWRDVAVRYKQTLLGPIWFLVQPILPTIVFTLIFKKMAGLSTDGLPGFLFFLSNQVAWGFFSATFTAVSLSLLSNQGLFSKVYFPRLIVPLSSLASNGVTLVIQLLVFAAAFLWYKFFMPTGDKLVLSAALLYLPALVLLIAVQSLGFGLWMAAITAKYRDLQQLSQVLIQLWMYGSAVVFPLSEVPEKYRTLVSLNPVAFSMESFRYCLLGQGTLTWQAGIYSLILSALVLMSGIRLFNKTARVFVDIA